MKAMNRLSAKDGKKLRKKGICYHPWSELQFLFLTVVCASMCACV